jgi:hypothetical protein
MNKTTRDFFHLNRKKKIKTLLGLSVFLGGIQLSTAQVTLPHYDGLNYTVGESLAAQAAGGWVINQTATSDLLITAGSLSYTGIALPVGNKVAFSSGGEDAIKTFTQTSAGTVYYSYLLNVTDVSAATGYVAGILANAVATSTAAPGSGAIAGTVWVKPSANAGFFNIGLSARANQTTVGTGPTNLQYGTTDYPLNAPVFVVVSYEMVAGSANDICNLWVNPVPGAAAPAFTFTTTPSTDIADVSGFFIKQNGGSSTPGVEMDEIRIGLNWADVTPGLPVPVVTPTLIADVTANTVDNDIDITFTENAAWRAAVTDVKIGATSLTASTDYELSAGNLKLKPSGLNALLTTSGSKAVTVVATGYVNDAVITQEINAGAPTANSSAVINNVLLPGLASIITCTSKDQYNNLVSGYAFKYDATVINNTVLTAESYLVDGAAITTTANDVSVTAVTDANGIATFTATLPALVDGDDGISIQVQLNDGTTNVGTTFGFVQLTSQTISFGALSPVTYGGANFNLTATASSALPVSYTSSNPLVATVTPEGVVTIVGVGSTSITASQAGNTVFNAALSISQELVVNCAASTAAISGASAVCAGDSANLQVTIAALETQIYTVVYTDGTTNYTVTNYSSNAPIVVAPSSTTNYSLISVTGTNANICAPTNSGSAIVTVNTTPAPTGNAAQTFTTNNPVLISDLAVTGTAVLWYSSAENALAGTSALASDFQVTSGNTYYAMQTVNGCASVAPLAVTVTVEPVAGTADFNLAGLKCYPNPMTDILNISYSEVITSVKIYNALGQTILVAQPDSVNPTINLQQLPASTYFVEIESNGNKKLVQLIKI